jgi:L-alanine-DL-glutamate epimerase-like enolase superfamily enzyme
MSTSVTVREVRLSERDVRLRMPFRFGVVTLTESPQAFVHVRVALPDGREGWGMAAEMLAAKWFDKNTALTNDDNFVQLRTALRICAEHYLADRTAKTPFALSAAHYPSQIAACGAKQLNPLIAGYGPALIDRAVLDALCRLHNVSFFEAMRANLPGMTPSDLAPDLAGFDFEGFLRGLTPRTSLHARHTVGLVDPITAADQDARVNDRLPETLEDVVDEYGHTYFKLKVGGRVRDDLARLTAIAAVLDRAPAPYHVTLDGNEQYESVEGVSELWAAMERAPALRRLVASTLFIEQPIARSVALDRDVGALSERRAVIIDESDGTIDAFPAARARGYRGVSTKSCKGFYKSFVNAARCAAWNAEAGARRYFMSAEDLTTQAGVSVQQDLALVALLGLEHVERNGHHYVNGMAALPDAEQNAFLKAHPDLYGRTAGAVRLRILEGRLAIGSLACPGFGVAAEPDWAAMRPMP